jgi:hypothetical protein
MVAKRHHYPHGVILTTGSTSRNPMPLNWQLRIANCQ